MGDVIYRLLIDNMTWSYSRLTCFESCPYQWFLKYITESEEQPMFYASYGSFMHKLLAMYYSGELQKEELPTKFLLDFQKEVSGRRPAQSTVEKYIKQGTDYLRQIEPFNLDTVAVEQKINFDIEGNHFVCFIDYLGRDEDGGLVIIDHKSRDMKPRSTRKKPTVKDRELDEMLRQQYIYAAAVEQKYGELPKKLCFNCFRTQVLIEEEFNQKAYEETKKWATSTIEWIKRTNVFSPRPEFHVCTNLCDVCKECCYVDKR